LYNFDGLVANFGFEKINFFGNAISEKQKLNTTQIENLIKKVLNAPMTTGGNSIFGLDSLGLIQFFYRFMQINVTGNLEEIIESNTKIDLVKNVKFGDIIFFGNKKIEHFGIVLSNKNILHVHGYARIDEYDYLGIKNFEKTDEYLFSKIYKIIRIL
jgi:cell wall-associated NlpC family hydrolase